MEVTKKGYMSASDKAFKINFPGNVKGYVIFEILGQVSKKFT